MLDGELVSADRRFACRLRWTLSVWMRPPTRTRLRFNSIPLRSDQPRVSWLGILVGSRATLNIEYIYIRKRRYAIPVTPRRNDRRDEKSFSLSLRHFRKDRKIEKTTNFYRFLFCIESIRCARNESSPFRSFVVWRRCRRRGL